MPKQFTIIIPTYNSDVYIKRTLRCLEQQTEKSFSILVIDDRSSDQTVPIVKNFKKIPISLIVKDKKFPRGAAESLNLAFRQIKTPFLAMIDSDTFLAKNWLAMIRVELNSHDLVGAPIFADKKASTWGQLIGLEIESRYNQIKTGELSHISTCNLAGKSEIFKNLRLSKKLFYAYDHQLSYLITSSGRRFFLTDKTYCFHLNKASARSAFVQQFNIAKYHLMLSKKMPKKAIENDRISNKALLIQPVIFSLALVFCFINLFIAAIFLLFLFLLNIQFLFYTGKKTKLKLIPLAIGYIFIRNTAWIAGGISGIFSNI